jgi:hypothetical protein
MFVDLPNGWPPPEPSRPRRPNPRLTPREQKVMGWIIGFNIVMLLLGPIAGTTLFDAVLAMLGR